MSIHAELGSGYRQVGYALLRSWLPSGTADYLANYLIQLARLGRLNEDPAIGGSMSIYGDAAFDVLMDMVAEELSEIVGARLVPTYSFARLYGQGSSLHRHRDRASCEHSVSVMLGAEGAEPWPLWIATDDGRQIPVHQSPGDAVCYQGCRLVHWRDPLPGAWHAQLFLHYVDGDGDRRRFALDQRELLGAPANPLREPEPPPEAP